MITSKDNKLIKYCLSIKQKKYSKLEKVCLVETYKVVKELLNTGLVKNILVEEDKVDLFQDVNVNIDVISKNISKLLSDAMTSDGVFAVCQIPENHNVKFDRCLILDSIQDPSNIGAIIRSARAFGFDTIFAINSVYPYTFKCIRSSMSYIFAINYIDTNIDEILKIKSKNNIKIVCADMSGKDIQKTNFADENIAIVIGNEGNGVSKELRNISDYTVSIPMKNNVESLNASVSASIFMYNLKK